METAIDIITIGLLTLGCFFALTGGVGILRMPDFFTRIHPAGKSDTLAQLLIIAALLLQADGWQTCLKLLLVFMFLMLTTPAATHAITLAAWLDGQKPWKASKPDRSAHE